MAWASRVHPSLRRASRPLRPAGPKPGRSTRESGGSFGCCPPSCSPGRPSVTKHPKPGLASTLVQGAGGRRSAVQRRRLRSHTRAVAGESTEAVPEDCNPPGGPWRAGDRTRCDRARIELRRQRRASALPMIELLGQRSAAAAENSPAAAASRTASSAEHLVRGQRKTPPGLPSISPALSSAVRFVTDRQVHRHARPE